MEPDFNMDELLTSEFSQDPLFKIIQRLGIEDDLFDDHILGLKPGIEYSTTHIEDWWCDEDTLKSPTMRSWLRQLGAYIETRAIGGRGNIRLDYRAVFRLRMCLLLRTHKYSLSRIAQLVGLKSIDAEMVHQNIDETATTSTSPSNRDELDVFRQLIVQMIQLGMIEVQNNMPVLKLKEMVAELVKEQQSLLPDPKEQQKLMDSKITEIETKISNQITSINDQLDPEKDKLQRKNDILTMSKVNRRLRQDALKIWNSKPESERTIKVGLFRRIEDVNKREDFIRNYQYDHFEEELNKEYK